MQRSCSHTGSSCTRIRRTSPPAAFMKSTALWLSGLVSVRRRSPSRTWNITGGINCLCSQFQLYKRVLEVCAQSKGWSWNFHSSSGSVEFHSRFVKSSGEREAFDCKAFLRQVAGGDRKRQRAESE